MNQTLGYKPYQLVLEGLSLAALLAGPLYLLFHWNALSTDVVSSFTLGGVIDGQGDLAVVRSLAVISLFLYGVFTAINLFPKAWRSRITTDSADVRLLAASLMRTQFIAAKLIMAAALSYMIWCSVAVRNLGSWFYPGLAVAIVALVTVCRIVMIQRARRLVAAPGDSNR